MKIVNEGKKEKNRFRSLVKEGEEWVYIFSEGRRRMGLDL